MTSPQLHTRPEACESVLAARKHTSCQPCAACVSSLAVSARPRSDSTRAVALLQSSRPPLTRARRAAGSDGAATGMVRRHLLMHPLLLHPLAKLNCNAQATRGAPAHRQHAAFSPISTSLWAFPVSVRIASCLDNNAQKCAHLLQAAVRPQPAAAALRAPTSRRRCLLRDTLRAV